MSRKAATMTRNSIVSTGQDSARFLPEMYNLPLSDCGPDEVLASDETQTLLNNFSVKLLLKISTVISAISVSLNTPVTFQYAPALRYVCLSMDIFTAVVFLIEMIIKIRIGGLVKVH